MEAGGGYQATREAAAVFDRSWRGKIAVAGGDRRAYLHAMLTNDVLALAPGSGCYAAYLTPQGRMIADMSVLELGDLVLLDLDPAATAAVLERLDKFIFSEDVKLGDLSEAFGKLTVVGPRSARVVARVISGPGQSGPGEGELAAWTEFRNVRASFRGQMALVSASWDTGEAGFDLYVERPQVPELAAALAAAGAVPADGADWDVLRVEAGRPAFGLDMDGDTTALEAGIEDRAISFTKGCYPGQEIVIRILHRRQGRIPRRIVGLRVCRRRGAEPGRPRPRGRSRGRARHQRGVVPAGRRADCARDGPPRLPRTRHRTVDPARRPGADGDRRHASVRSRLI